MSEQIQPVTVTHDTAARTPRTFGSDIIRELVETNDATPLSDHQRLRMFVRYDNTWWVDAGTIFIEILDADQNSKLDRWHQRLTTGSLWS